MKTPSDQDLHVFLLALARLSDNVDGVLDTGDDVYSFSRKGGDELGPGGRECVLRCQSGQIVRVDGLRGQVCT